MGAAGAFLQGLMGAGLPEVTTTQLLLRGKLPPRIAVATSVTTLTVTVFFAALIHALGGEPPWHVALWSCPGALTGAQFGARLQAKLPPNVSQRFLAVDVHGRRRPSHRSARRVIKPLHPTAACAV